MISAPTPVRGAARRLCRSALATAAVLLAGILVPPASAATISASAQQQMAQIAAFKDSLSPAEQKMSLQLVLQARAAQGQPLGVMSKFLVRESSTLPVTVSGYMTPSLLTSPAMRGIDKVNGQIPSSVYSSGRAAAHVSATDLLAIASHPDVTSLRESLGVHTNAGSVTSQGFVAHQANQVIASGINGAGVRVGVLSDSATPGRVAALIASGDLPSNTVVLPGEADDGMGDGEDEGAAMMEIVHDIAPGAQLFFATAYKSEQSFADNIRALRFQYHCDIIVDDISYFDEPVFQDGMVAQAVNDITKDGGLYFSSAANSGNLTSGTSGTWEGDFKSYGSIAPFGNLHNFALSGAPQPFDVLTGTGTAAIIVQWSDPWGKANDDYDLYILDPTGTSVKAVSIDTQNGKQDPIEGVGVDCVKAGGYCPEFGDLILVSLRRGQTRALHLDTERGMVSIGTAAATFGHNAGKNTISMAATYWNSAKTGVRPFDGKDNPVETFSSDGPRKIFYQPDGTPLTPGRYTFASSGGTTLQKPDNTAADGVSCRTPGFAPFFGTSAAAPHAAAIAALIKSANPALTNTQIAHILHTTPLDNMSPGWDRNGGFGVLTAPAAVAAAKPK